jgi:hypothetical protein
MNNGLATANKLKGGKRAETKASEKKESTMKNVFIRQPLRPA